MKVTMEVDCTPEEARRFMGLPDVTKANDIYVDALASAMKGGGGLEQMQDLVKQVAPMGQFGLKLFQQFIENSTSMATMGGGGSRKGDS
jgi:Family of unknown function (DUF6489)